MLSPLSVEYPVFFVGIIVSPKVWDIYLQNSYAQYNMRHKYIDLICLYNNGLLQYDPVNFTTSIDCRMLFPRARSINL